MAIDISIITATWRRPHLLALCLSQVRRQICGSVCFEHIVVSDGPDAQAKCLAESWGAIYTEHEQNHADWGASCHDTGLQLANGKYCVFWNDDNEYYDSAISDLYEASRGVDIGVCQCYHWHNVRRQPLPRNWSGTFEYGDIDTMNCCVKTEVAHTQPWVQQPAVYGCDYHWYRSLQENGATCRFLPRFIGSHLCFDRNVPHA